jgi:hypothetical protein
MATFHLLLEYAISRGWLRRAHRPPFEILQVLSDRSGLNPDDLAFLTWAYSRAAYSPLSPSEAEVSRVQQAWSRLKPNLLTKGERKESLME